ncbi:18156_t:CDS:2, partial [Funneliformis geosporum]
MIFGFFSWMQDTRSLGSSAGCKIFGLFGWMQDDLWALRLDARWSLGSSAGSKMQTLRLDAK